MASNSITSTIPATAQRSPSKTLTGAALSLTLPLGAVLLLAVAVHGPLLMMELPNQSQDATTHIFFAQHYAHSWFNPWNEKWFGGFSQTTSPPLVHQWIAVFSRVMSINLAYMLVQMIALVLLTLGVFRFARVWVDEPAAKYAAISSVFLGSLAWMIYLSGQLPTTLATALLLLAAAELYQWSSDGSMSAFLRGVLLVSASAAADHITFLFASVFFGLPILVAAVRDRKSGSAAVISRAIVFGLLATAGAAVIMLPFWMHWFQKDVPAVTLPHGSRDNFLFHFTSAMNFFIVPLGALLLALPFIFVHGSLDRRLRVLFLSFCGALLLGLGGSTPVAKYVLGQFFDLLTLDRFLFWATLLALPIVGLLAFRLIQRYGLRAVAGLVMAAVLTFGLSLTWWTKHLNNSAPIKTTPVLNFLGRDNHNRYRYLTLGFGAASAEVATHADAQTLDGAFSGGQLLPELAPYGWLRLDDAKSYPQGMDALRAVLKHANQYGLKYIFVRDRFYDPLVAFAGWRPVESYNNGNITLWSKEDVPVARPSDHADILSPMQRTLWGTLPMVASLLLILLYAFWWLRRSPQDAAPWEPVAAKRGIGAMPFVMACVFLALIAVGATREAKAGNPGTETPDGAVQSFFHYVQAHDFDSAFAMLAPDSQANKDAITRELSGGNGSLRTLATLQKIDTNVLQNSNDTAKVRANLQWSTAVGALGESRDVDLQKTNGQWRIVWPAPAKRDSAASVEKSDYLRWDIIQRGAESRDDWGAQNVEPPHMRIISMNAIEKDGSVIILGEVVNEDTVPGFITVNATLLDKNGNPFAEESSFDKVSHTLLPREVSPFRIDFPRTKLAQIKSVRMSPTTLLAPASADPVIGVFNQRVEKDMNGHSVLRGQLVNQGGKPVSIPHVLATFYDNAGRVIWVSDGYVDQPLLPASPAGFSVSVRDDVVPNIKNFRVTVNHFSEDRS